MFCGLVVLILPQEVRAEGVLGTWSANTPLPYSNASFVSFDHGNILFFAGGQGAGPVHDEVWSSLINLNGDIVGWESSSSAIPKPLIWHMSDKKDERVYVLGGINISNGDADGSVSLGVIDGSGVIGEWLTLTPLPLDLQLGSAKIIGDRIYYSGGFEVNGTVRGEVYFADINGADGTIGVWELAGNLPVPSFGHVMVENNGHLIVLGGFNQGGYVTQFTKALIMENGSLGPWEPIEEIGLPVYRSTPFIIGGNLVLVGGVGDATRVYYAQMLSDGGLGPWQEDENSLPVPIGAASGAILGNHVYILGGYNGVYLDSVYTAEIDGIAPTPTPLVKKVVLVPGMEASWNADAILNCKLSDYEGGWTLAPYAEFAYQPILDKLSGINGVEAHPHYYDWRLPVTLNGVGLGSHIDSIAGLGKVEVVGHSMGGLVSREYLRLVENANKIERLLTVGSPHRGAVSAYPAWSAGEIWGDNLIQRIALTLLLKSCGGPFKSDDRQVVENYFPSVQDVLPVFEYLKDKKSGDYIELSNMVATNSGVLNLPFVSPYFGATVGTLSGTGRSTLAELEIISSNPRDMLLSNWIDGRPTTRLFSFDGDGTVLNASSILPGASLNQLINQDHVGIISSQEGIDTILDFLDIDGTLGLTGSSVRPSSALVVAAYPGEFEIVDEDGKVISSRNGIAVVFNPGTGRRTVRSGGAKKQVMMVGRFFPDGRYNWRRIDSVGLGNDDYVFDY